MSNYKINYSNELYHFGILGMKWGVRRFRNKDGSLTEAGEKRYRKNIEYRDRRSQKLKRLASDRLKTAEDARLHAENIKREGYNSNEFKDYLRKQEDEEVNKYIREKTKTGYDEFGFEVTEGPSDLEVAKKRLMIRAGNEFANKLGLFDQQIRDLQHKYEDEYDDNINRAHYFIDKNENLMRMNITAFTTKKDFRKASGNSFDDVFH